VKTGQSYANALKSTPSSLKVEAKEEPFKEPVTPMKSCLPAATATLTAAKPGPLHHEPPRFKVTISGKEAIVGWDTECSTVLISTKFAHLHKLPYTNVSHKLQLGVAGSKGQIKGIHVGEVMINNRSMGKVDFGVANLPDVDAYLGAPVLDRWGAVIDCRKRTISFKDQNMVLQEETGKICTVAAMSFGKPVEKAEDAKEPGSVEHEGPMEELQTQGDWFEQCRLRLLNEFPDVLVDKIPADWIPPLRKDMNHRIPVIDSDKKYPSRPLRIPKAYESAVRKHWKDMEKIGTAIPAPEDKQSSPLFTVPKKEPGKFREVFDLRARNENTRKEQILLPHRAEIIAKLAGAKWISKIDLPDCFLQFRVEPEDVKYTTVATPFGQFRMTVMQMGDTNAPATCQRAMGILSQGLQGDVFLVFIDDGWVVTNGTKEEHFEMLREVLGRFRKHKFLVSKPKSGFFMDRVNVLGELRDNVNGIRVPEHEKVRSILEYPTPTNAGEVSSFLGMYNFLTDYAGTESALIGSNITPLGAHDKRTSQKGPIRIHTNPLLTDYVNTRGRLKCTPRHQEAFEQMKRTLLRHPYLKDFENDESKVDTYVLIDSCLTGTGGCIGQVGKNEEWYLAKPTRYFSKSFNSAQMNYAVHEQETLGLYLFLKENEIELRGRKFVVLTDNDCLMRLRTRSAQQLSPREVRMLQYLDEFDMTVKHIPGTANVVADAISRVTQNARYGSAKLYGQEAEAIKPLKLMAMQGGVPELQIAVKENIEAALSNDGFTKAIVENIDRHRDFQLTDGLLWLKEAGRDEARLVDPKALNSRGNLCIASSLKQYTRA